MLSWLQAIASLRLTLWLLLLLGLSILVEYQWGLWAGGLYLPLTLLTLNLIAAVGTHPRFRSQPALLIFHLALIAVVLLLGMGQLVYLQARIAVAEGGLFMGDVSDLRMGPLHNLGLDRVRFQNLGFGFRVDPNSGERVTTNRVRWWGDGDQAYQGEITDGRPLVMQGYRFYPTLNFGFSPTIAWYPSQGRVDRGPLYLPAL